jgi:hypothetical protein
MRPLALLTFSILIFSCANYRQKKTAAEKPQQFKCEISLSILDTSDLEISFWKINRQLELLYPENFKKPLDMSDTSNKFYVTHLLKKYITTIGGREILSNSLPSFCVAKSDTSKLRKFFSNTLYKTFFPQKTSFAYGIETIKNNGCLDLFCISDTSLEFKNSEIAQISLIYSANGEPAIGVKLNEDAGKKLKTFSESFLKRRMALLINGSVFNIATITAPLDKNYFDIVPKMTRAEIEKFLESIE